MWCYVGFLWYKAYKKRQQNNKVINRKSFFIGVSLFGVVLLVSSSYFAYRVFWLISMCFENIYYIPSLFKITQGKNNSIDIHKEFYVLKVPKNTQAYFKVELWMLSLALFTFISRIILVCYSIYAIKNKEFLASI